MADEKKAGLDKIDLENLFLDSDNPRLPTQLHGANSKEIMQHLVQTTSIDDLMESIASHGYFEGEPLVACPDGDGEGNYIVVEGNRRLTALKLLLNPYEIDNPSARIRSISQSAENKPTEVPVVVSHSRADVLPYLGFRHITGVKQWESLAKARYIYQLFQTFETDLSADERYKKVARLIGSKSHSIKRNLDALAVYELIEENSFFNIEGVDEDAIKFSVLSTALADENIARLTGVSSSENGEDFEPSHPIVNRGKIRTSEIKNLTSWLFKKEKGGKAKVAESRQIRDLSKIVESERALAAFKDGSSLTYAYRLSSGVQDDFSAALYEAESALSSAASMVASVDFEKELLDLSHNLKDNIILIGKTLRSKQQSRDEDDAF